MQNINNNKSTIIETFYQHKKHNFDMDVYFNGYKTGC